MMICRGAIFLATMYGQLAIACQTWPICAHAALPEQFSLEDLEAYICTCKYKDRLIYNDFSKPDTPAVYVGMKYMHECHSAHL